MRRRHGPVLKPRGTPVRKLVAELTPADRAALDAFREWLLTGHEGQPTSRERCREIFAGRVKNHSARTTLQTGVPAYLRPSESNADADRHDLHDRHETYKGHGNEASVD